MSSKLFYDSDDERDSFDVERRQIEMFRTNGLSAFSESSEDDEEGIIDGSIVPSSSKARSRARHFFLDLSTVSSSPSVEQNNDADDESDLEGNPFDIISKSIDIDLIKPAKKQKSLGVRKSRILLDTTDIYDKDENDEMDPKLSKTNKSDKKSRIQKPTKATILETERKMQQLSRSEHLVLPTFIPKALETWQALGKRSRQELLNEIRAKNPSFTPQDPDLPEILVVDAEPTAASTLADLTKIIEDKPSPKINKLSRFLNADILNKKPTISSLSKQSNIMIDLSDTKKPSNPPTVKSSMNISLNCIKSPASKKQLLEMQKQLGIRMRAKRTAMLAENAINIPMKDDDDVEDADDNDEVTMDTTDESNDTTSDVLSTTEKDNEILQIDEETRRFISDEDEAEEEEEEEKENTNPPTDPNRPSLKTILARMESSTELPQAAPSDQNGQTEWFASSRPAEFDTNLELLCSGAFGGDNVILPSQNYTHVEPMAFSPLPTTQIDDDDDIVATKTTRSKVRQLIDDEDEPLNSGSTIEESEEEEEEEDNEELVDYKKQLFEMEAEESGSEVDEKEVDEESDNEEPDEELAEFIDTAAIEMDENDLDNMAKVHLKIKAKEDEQQLKLLKEQYLDFDGDDDGRRIQISKGPIDDEDEDDDPDFHSEVDDEDDEDPTDRISELERQRSIQDNQAEELHLDEDLDHIGQYSSMFQKGLALKQKKIHNTTESINPTTTDSTSKKSNSTRSVTLTSVLLAQRFSSTLLAPVNKNNLALPHNNTTNETSKKQHNPRRHVFATNTSCANVNENQNPVTSAGEKRANSVDKSPTMKIKRFKQSTATILNTKPKESSASVFSALALSTIRR